MGNVQSAVRAYDQPWRPAPGDLVELGRTLRLPLGQLRLQRTPVSGLKRRDKWALALLVVALHGAAAYWVSQSPTPPLPVVPPQIPPMTIEFAAPAPPVVEPPPPAPAPPIVEPPPPPVVDELAAKPAPKLVPKPKPKPAPKPVAKPEPKPVETPPPPVAAPAPVAPPAPAPVTPPSANAAYLKNPAPEYPQMAQRRGWEGTVLLRVEVLASGKPGQIQIQKSSGRDALDAAALAAVKRWSFVPAKQGDVAQSGWVSVPIDFKLR
ncbi:energy transducer TonB [Pseudomonas urmiensis]|uniref:Energy transducer TonB n=2 Tax=Pseudomonas TaxID=286 RepID=A0A923G1E4_9PSED|nr:energy transducer TonB [Pseudomonas urmiensis]MBV4539003.1 energy transducer TonB [Pseudomonas urmiensis]